MEEHLTVGRVAGLADVSVRTLHHDDEIGLVRRSERTAAGYRAYTAGDVERLREVIAYRRLGFGLREIADLVDDPDTDAVAHLRRLRGLLVDWPSPTDLTHAIGGRAEPVLIPWDCADGFFEAHWRRPEAYLDEQVRRAVSVWTRVGPEAEQRVVDGLRVDLSSGRWVEQP